MNNREKFEQLILASPLFSLDKEKDETAYKREARKMVEYLYNYLLAINESRYIDYGLEITQTANRCIENFDPSNGDFLHYFNAAMKTEYTRESAKRATQEIRKGIHLSEEDDRIIRKVQKYMKAKGITDPTDDQIRKIARGVDISVETVEYSLRAIYETTAISDTAYNDDGEEISLLDTIAVDNGICEEIESAEGCKALLDKIESEFHKLQSRTMPVISAMLTVKICKTVCDNRITIDGYTFIDREIITDYVLNNHIPTQRDIADRFGKNEASISRTVKEFVEKLKITL